MKNSVFFWILYTIFFLLSVAMTLFSQSIGMGLSLGILLILLIALRKVVFKKFFISLLSWFVTVILFLFIVGIFVQTPETLLYKQSLQPSSKEQTVTYENIKIKIPGGLLKKDEELRILKPSSKIEPLVIGMKQAIMLDIKLGELTKFERPLTIEVPYDKNFVNSKISLKSQFTVCYFDEVLNGWISTPFSIDKKKNVLTIKTKHLTKWSAYYTLWGYDTFPGKRCTIIYDKAGLKNNNSLYQNRTGRSAPSNLTPLLVQDIALFFDQATLSYEREGLKLDDKVNVFVGAAGNSYRNSKSGIITINDALVSQARGQELINLLRQECAHELFHEAQANKFGVSGLTALYYENKTFWIEATADYAADILAWKHAKDRDGSSFSRTNQMGDEINKDYLKYSIFTANSTNKYKAGHEYSTSYFVEYMMNRFPNAPPNVLITLLGRDNDFVTCFNEVYKKSDYNLARFLLDYSAYFLFNKNSAFPKDQNKLDAIDESETIKFKLKNDTSGNLESNEISKTLTLSPKETYSTFIQSVSSEVLGLTSEENLTAEFEYNISSDKRISVVVADSDLNTFTQVKDGLIKISGSSKISASKKIIILYTTGKEIIPANVTVTVTYKGAEKPSNSKASPRPTTSIKPSTDSGKTSDLSISSNKIGLGGIKEGNHVQKSTNTRTETSESFKIDKGAWTDRDGNGKVETFSGSMKYSRVYLCDEAINKYAVNRISVSCAYEITEGNVEMPSKTNVSTPGSKTYKVNGIDVYKHEMGFGIIEYYVYTNNHRIMFTYTYDHWRQYKSNVKVPKKIDSDKVFNEWLVKVMKTI